MKKSAYMLLTIVAAFAALFFLGYWMGYGITLNRANVERRIHEAWCRTDDRRAHDPSCRLDSVFVWELIDKNFRRLKFHLDTVALADSTVRLRADLRYHADYARELEEVRIASWAEEGYTRISVRDNGIGIPLAAQATIFDKFERVLPADDGKGKKITGFGLGLSYVMNVVREHGGYVTVESVEGKFSEFTLSLPLPDEGPEADAREG